jgi:DivIVA domain-containing protein
MDLSPQQVRSTTFRTVKKGYDPQEVETFRAAVADAVESAQNHSMAMEARARAAVAKLQEVAAGEGTAQAAAHVPAGEDVETISRTLLLAQKTADATVSEARSEATSLTSNARAEASSILDGARTMAGKLIDEAKAEARRSADSERVRAENEVQALLARRDFLLADVDHLEQYILAQRERLRDAAVSLQELVDRVPGGLGDMRRPLLSASNESAHATAPADTHLVDDHAPEAQVAAPQDEHDGIDRRERHDDRIEPADADRGAHDTRAGTAGEPAAASPAQAADEARSTTIDDVWRSLGDVDDTPASPSAAAVAFDFGLDTSQTPTNQLRPDPDLTLGGDDIN